MNRADPPASSPPLADAPPSWWFPHLQKTDLAPAVGVLGLSKAKQLAPVQQGIGVIGASDRGNGVGVMGLSTATVEPLTAAGTIGFPREGKDAERGTGTGILGASGAGIGVYGQ